MRRRISLEKKKKCFWVGKPIQHFNFQMADHVNVHSHSLWRKQIILTFGIEQWTAKHNSRSELLMSSKSNKVFKDDINREKKKQTNKHRSWEKCHLQTIQNSITHSLNDRNLFCFWIFLYSYKLVHIVRQYQHKTTASQKWKLQVPSPRKNQSLTWVKYSHEWHRFLKIVIEIQKLINYLLNRSYFFFF